MIVIKNKSSIEKMRVAGKLLALVMEHVSDFLKPGLTTIQVNDFIEKHMLRVGLKPKCKGYFGYRYASCISLNDVIVHGVPSKDSLKDGDFVKIDVVGSYKNYCADMARYFFIGSVCATTKKLAHVAQKSLDSVIDTISAGNRVSDISFNIQSIVEGAGFNVVRDFVGHGIGKNMHEAPEIPNFGKPGNGPLLREGMTLAIEPMITQKSCDVKIMSDGWTAKTVDGGLSAHVEDTVLITNNGVEVLTRLSKF